MHFSWANAIAHLLLQKSSMQCDQMARFCFHLWPCTTLKFCPIFFTIASSKFCQKTSLSKCRRILINAKVAKFRTNLVALASSLYHHSMSSVLWGEADKTKINLEKRRGKTATRFGRKIKSATWSSVILLTRRWPNLSKFHTFGNILKALAIL